MNKQTKLVNQLHERMQNFEIESIAFSCELSEKYKIDVSAISHNFYLPEWQQTKSFEYNIKALVENAIDNYKAGLCALSAQIESECERDIALSWITKQGQEKAFSEFKNNHI